MSSEDFLTAAEMRQRHACFNLNFIQGDEASSNLDLEDAESESDFGKVSLEPPQPPLSHLPIWRSALWRSYLLLHYLYLQLSL